MDNDSHRRVHVMGSALVHTWTLTDGGTRRLGVILKCPKDSEQFTQFVNMTHRNVRNQPAPRRPP